MPLYCVLASGKHRRKQTLQISPSSQCPPTLTSPIHLEKSKPDLSYPHLPQVRFNCYTGTSDLWSTLNVCDYRRKRHNELRLGKIIEVSGGAIENRKSHCQVGLRLCPEETVRSTKWVQFPFSPRSLLRVSDPPRALAA